MKKTLVSAVATMTLFGASIASAQAYYPTYNYSYPTYQPAPSYTGSCATIGSNLSMGSRGNDVSTLQRFLVSQNYPGGGSWMITGYFGKATEAAVRTFQSTHALSITGMVDAQTRAVISQVSCGYATSYPYLYNNGVNNYPYNYNYPSTVPTYNTYPYNSFNYNYNYNANGGYGACGFGVYNCGNPSITYLSPVSGAVGSTVTIYGSGFSTNGNTVHFGQGIITNLSSPDGRSVSFTVPVQLTGFGSAPVVMGSYPVSVTNAQGVSSNSVSYSVTSIGSIQAPVISNLTGPTSLTTGTQGTWTLTLSTPLNGPVSVSVNWGDQNAYAQNATQQLYLSGTQTLTFTHSYISSGTYTATFTVSGAGGSHVGSATVSVNGGTTNGPLSLQYLSPSSGSIGTVVNIQGSGFTANGNVVHFGLGGKVDVASNGSVISFVVPSTVSPCDLIVSGTTCGAPVMQVTPGTYPVYVTNSTGATNVLYYVVQ